MESNKTDYFQCVENENNDKGVSPLIWGGALSLLTLLFLAVMLAF